MAEPTVVTDRSTFRALATETPVGGRVPVEVRLSVGDPFDAYRRARDGPGGVYLETTGGRSGWGYFAVDPVERLQVSANAVLADPDTPGHGDFARPSPSLAALDGLLSGETLVRGDCEVPYPCGAFGWLSYDVARELESLPSHTVDDRALPHLQVGVYDRVAAWREPRGESDEETTLHVTCCPRIPSNSDLDAVYDDALDRALELAEATIAGDPSVGPPPVDAREAEFVSDCGREVYADRVRRVKAYIRDGDTFQANIAQRLVAPAAVHPVDAYAALRRVNPAPYSGLVEFSGPGWSGGIDLVSASPELLLERDGDRLVTEPIAGTRPRGKTPDEDQRLEADLLGDEKERAEHAMLVDLERNDLGKVSEYGSVEVTDYRRVDRYSEVMHLVSLVEGRLRSDATLADAVAATFPGGTITGAPKPRTMEIIDELEATRRGPYTGSMAVFGFDGRATLNIVIRTLVRWRDEYHLRVGAGIVHDSDPDSEYDETLAKGRALVNAIDEALGERGDLRVEEVER
ncbi:aminodeoxychorismate synthase, component I [Halogranum rubrum]|uniref:anthranilate synthase n=1 Tax=Halogranum salarium B-1 TaxID=1210908 RepID=J2ZIP2_9EURY|nr:aminodeoxychorismate synthase, component I [Halogranum salarium]EJN60590.1 anthranilate synthase, component I 2 [Halogranum salarium B-1]